MCGICGVFAYGSAATLDEERLARMSGQMVHRGPDDAGVYLSPDRKLGLGFRRLSIVDLSPTGHQPMANEDGSVWIVFNGEIYNHAEHRQALEARGHAYRGRSDTETILHLYEEHGCECVQHLRGMFAFAIWDEVQGRLFLARDRVGVKPLYYMLKDGAFVFGSEVKALMAWPGATAELDEQALFHYLTFMVPPAPLTLFAGIRKLPPGHWLTVDRSGTLREQAYWDPLGPGPEPAPELAAAEAVERIRDVLEESVRLRMMSDVPVGAFLSGGIDSSTIVALMARHSGRPVNTFTVGYEDSPESNELEHARRVAREFGAEHREVMVGARDMLEYMPRLVHTQDEPIADPVCVPLYYVSELAHRSGVKVVLVGEGSDELFCGYPWFLPYLSEQRRWERLAALLPQRWLRAAYGAAAEGLRATGRGADLMQMLERRATGQPTFWGGAVVFSGRTKRELLNPARWNGSHLDSSRVVERHASAALERMPALDLLGRMGYLELKHRLPELLLMRVDKVAMSVSLEGRVPFLDHRLVELVLPLPMRLKLGSGRPKDLLKRVVRGWIPQAIVDRPKQGFPAPVKEWFRRMPEGALRSALLDGPLAKRDYFERGFVERMLAEQRSGRRNWSAKLWVLYNLSAWYAHWIEGPEIL